MSAHALDFRVPTRRTAFLFAIVAAHALVAWAFINMSIHRNAAPDVGPVVARLITEPKIVEPPPPPPDVPLETGIPKPDLPTPLFTIEVPADKPVISVPEIIGPPPGINTPLYRPLPTGAEFVGAPPDPNKYYPPDAVIRGEQGNVVVRLCVNADGRFDGPPRVTSSSGFASLDAAALRWGRDVRQLRPATVEGAPIHSCRNSRVVFKLH